MSARRRRRHGTPRPVTDFIPTANGLPRRHWIKFWIERWRSSPRVRATTYAQHGLYLGVLVYAAEHDGVFPMTIDDYASTLGLGRKDRRGRFNSDLEKLFEVGLLEKADDGTLIVPRFEELQS